MTVGIIAEFNPFHKGHEYLIKKAKENGDTVVCALSGNFVQRGDIAVFSKQKRTAFALKAGADIAVEIPTVFCMSTAQHFALSGVWQLYNMGCEKIIFGSECGDISALRDAADILNSDGFFSRVTAELKSGITFATARENAAKQFGIDTALLRGANDNLGIEYILAAKKLKLPIGFECIKRKGALHSCSSPEGEFASGTYIRQKLLSGEYDTANKYMPDFVSYTKDDIADFKNIDRAVCALLRQRSLSDFENLPDMSEGLSNRIFEAVKKGGNFDEIAQAVKSKRYTLSRIRRLLLYAALKIDNTFFMRTPPYTRILGANKEGLSALKSTVSITPVISKAKETELLDGDCKKVFTFECRATDLFNLSFNNPLSAGSEYTEKFIKTEEI